MRLTTTALAIIVAAGAVHAAGPLDARVTISYRAADAVQVLTALASGAGLRAQVAAGSLKPVTITLTNVRLANALHAVCDTAMCDWRTDGATLFVTPLPSEQAAALDAEITFAVRDASPADAFRALGSALGVAVSIQGDLPSGSISLSFRNASTSLVLNTLCEASQCRWDYDPARGLTITRKP